MKYFDINNPPLNHGRWVYVVLDNVNFKIPFIGIYSNASKSWYYYENDKLVLLKFDDKINPTHYGIIKRYKKENDFVDRVHTYQT